MALGYLDDSKLYAIASAIRAKTGDSSTMTVDDMPDEIGSISTGAQVEPLSVTENGTYSAPTGYAYSPVTVDVAGGGGYSADDIALREITSAIGSVTVVSDYAFAGCRRLEVADFSKCEVIGVNAFAECISLSSVSFPNADNIKSYAFANCSSLTTIDLPNVGYISASAFTRCQQLSRVTMDNVKSLYQQVFSGCFRLLEVRFDNISSVPRLGMNVFYSTPLLNYTTYTGGVSGSIYVPASLYDSFLAAAGWSSFSSRIVSV